jgi:hypothetical protein
MPFIDREATILLLDQAHAAEFLPFELAQDLGDKQRLDFALIVVVDKDAIERHPAQDWLFADVEIDVAHGVPLPSDGVSNS